MIITIMMIIIVKVIIAIKITIIVIMIVMMIIITTITIITIFGAFLDLPPPRRCFFSPVTGEVAMRMFFQQRSRDVHSKKWQLSRATSIVIFIIVW